MFKISISTTYPKVVEIDTVVAALYDNEIFQRFRRYKVYHRSVMSHRYSYDPSAEYLKAYMATDQRNIRVLTAKRERVDF